MPAYNFQRQFVPMILDGSKPHTIRRRRKRPTRVGDMLMLYTGMRTKQCKLIAISECVKITPIDIWIQASTILINGVAIGDDEMFALIERDGFKRENYKEFFQFFKRYERDVLDDFEIIWWSVDLLMPVNGNRKGGEYRMRLGAK